MNDKNGHRNPKVWATLHNLRSSGTLRSPRTLISLWRRCKRERLRMTVFGPMGDAIRRSNALAVYDAMRRCKP